MNKRLASLTLAMVMALVALVGFAPEAMADEEPMHLTWTAYQVCDIKEDAMMIDYWNDFFNVDIEVWNLDNSIADQQLGLWFAAGDVPDVMISGFALAKLASYVDQRVIAPIPMEMIEEHMPNLLAKWSETAPNWLTISKIDGVLYGLPRTINYQAEFHAPLVYNGVWMDNLGVTEVPATLEDFEELMYKFTFEDPDGNGVDDTYGLSKSGLNAVYGAFGYIPKQWKPVGGELAYTSILPEMKDALATLAKWYSEGVLVPDYISGENFGGYWGITNSFTEGHIGFTGHGNYYHWHGDIGLGENFNPAAMEAVMGKEYAENIRFGQPLTGPYGEGVINRSAEYDGTQIAFGAQLANQPEKMAKVLEMIEYWAGGDIENYITARYGIKGEMWEYNDNGVPTLIGDWATDTDKLYAEGAMTICQPVSLIEHDALLYKNRYNWALENEFNKGNGTYSELFTALPSAGTYQSELNKIENEAYTAIITGNQPIEYFDTFVAEWLANGGQTLTDEANAWFATLG